MLLVNREIIDKITNGDPVLGWEGDDRLAVVLEAETPKGPVWALYRVEESGRESFVVRTEPGIPLDERIIHWLCEHDIRRKDKYFDLDKVVRDTNAKVDADRQAAQDEYIAEELAPRLRHAMMKDGV